MVTRLDDDARRRVLTLAAGEAKRRGDGRIGTEHILLALLQDSGSLAAHALGTDLASARAALDDLDRQALAAVGIEVAYPASVVPVRTRRRPPFSSGARAVFHRAVLAARAGKAKRISARHLLLGVLGCQRPDPAAELLAALGVSVAQARERLTGPP